VTALYYPGRALARFCFNVFGRMEVSGRENVPPYGPLIVVANHISYNDPPSLAAALPRPLSFLGKKELFVPAPKGWLFNSLRVFPVDRSFGVSAVRMALDRAGRAVFFARSGGMIASAPPLPELPLPPAPPLGPGEMYNGAARTVDSAIPWEIEAAVREAVDAAGEAAAGRAVEAAPAADR